MIVKIQVTADDIAKGHDGDGCHCPIARACQRTFPALPDLVVGRWDLFADGDDVDGLSLLPGPAVEFIERFDMYRDAGPFEFDIDVPDELAPGGAS